MERFNTLISWCVREGLSDVHITGGHPVIYRKNGLLDFDKGGRWSHSEVDRLVGQLITPLQLAVLRKRRSIDFAISSNKVRLRINVFNTTRGLSIAIRILPGVVPSIDALNLHPSLRQIADARSGLVLICGAAGTGKSTTIAAIINEINQVKSSHVVTLEDPIEYRFASKRSFIEQRELGEHIPSFEQGLVDVLREDPDVILVGELRDAETMRLALNAAEAGHLIIASLHATNSEDAVYRICNSFPPDVQRAVRTQVASTLTWLIVQRLSYLERAGFRVPFLSIMRGTSAIKNIIRENKLAQIESTMQTSKGEGMFSSEAYAKDYIEKRTSFSSPSEIFRPSPELDESVYRSPLLDPEGVCCTYPAKSESSGPEMREGASPGPVEAPAGTPIRDIMVIGSEPRLEEVIDNIKKSGHYGEE